MLARHGGGRHERTDPAGADAAHPHVFEVGEAQGARQDFLLHRSVDTRGWISADLHVHAVRSHDSGVILADRALSRLLHKSWPRSIDDLA